MAIIPLTPGPSPKGEGNGGNWQVEIPAAGPSRSEGGFDRQKLAFSTKSPILYQIDKVVKVSSLPSGVGIRKQ
jgi:hypothetical protein